MRCAFALVLGGVFPAGATLAADLGDTENCAFSEWFAKIGLEIEQQE